MNQSAEVNMSRLVQAFVAMWLVFLIVGTPVAWLRGQGEQPSPTESTACRVEMTADEWERCQREQDEARELVERIDGAYD